MSSVPPSVARIVHYQPDDGAAPLAAWILRVNRDGTVDLGVFPPGSGLLQGIGVLGVAQSDRPRKGCWNWPPKVQ